MLIATSLAASDIDSLSLITPISYVKPAFDKKKLSTYADMYDSITSTATSKIKSGTAALFNIDIEKKVMKKITPFKSDLKGCFPSDSALDQFLKSTVQKGIKQYLNEVTDANFIKFYGYLGNELIGTLAYKILDREGVKDSTRKNLWTKKLLVPFNACIKNANNAQSEADHCIDALISSMVPTTGVAVVFELSRANLSPSLPEKSRASFNVEQVNDYRSCIKTANASAQKVTSCALSTMKSGVLKVTDLSLTKTINSKSSSSSKAGEIKKLVWPSFNSCTQKVGSTAASRVSYSDQFMNCIDDLVEVTGAQLVMDKISKTPSVTKAFNASEVSRLSTSEATNFRQCAVSQKQKGARKDGMLDISTCEDLITNNVTYKVVAQTLTMSAADSFKTNKAQATKMGNEGIKLLDKCWNKTQASAAREACLRKTIVAFSGSIATIKLNEAIPDDTPGKANLNRTSVASFTQCIEKELPKNISESNDFNSKIDKCIDSMVQSVGSNLVKNKILNTPSIAGAFTTSELNQLAAQQSTQFEKCAEAQKKKGATKNGILDTTPCEEAITNDVTYQVVSKTLRKTATDSFKTNKAQATKIGNEGIKILDKCWNKNQTPVARESCLKKTIVEFSGVVANLRLDEVIPNGTSGKANLTKTSVATLTQCIEKELPKNISESNEIDKKLDNCINNMIQSVGSYIVKDKISSTPSISAALSPTQVNKLATEKSAQFEKCAEAQRKKGASRDGMLDISPCEDAITNEVTYQVVSQTLRNTAAESFKTNSSQATKIGNEGIRILDKCWNKNQTSVARESCLKKTIVEFSGVVATLKLDEAIPNGTEGRANLTKNSVASLGRCIEKELPKNISEANDIDKKLDTCINNMIQSVGSYVVKDKITNTPSISAVLSPSEVNKLAAQKSAQFEKCAEAQRKKGAMKNGMLDIEPCEEAITNEVTYQVVSSTLRKTANDSLKKNPTQATKIGNDGVLLLDKCWNTNQTPVARETCLRKTIVEFSGIVATTKLEGSFPPKMPGKTNLINSSVSALTQCIERELPKNISEANDITAKIEGCTGTLIKTIAIPVAEYQIRDTVGTKLTATQTDALVKTFVQDDFSKCIGAQPTDAKLEICSNDLTTKAAKHISGISFTKEVNAYLTTSGGLQSLGVTQVEVNSFLENLNRTNNECIDKKLSATVPVMDQVNSCLKGSVKKIAFFFGDLKFNKSIGNMYAGRDADRRLVEDQFRKSLGECLGTKESKEFSIEDYTANLYTCSDQVTGSISLTVGKDQVDTSLNQYLKDRPGINLKSERDSIGNKLLGDFKACMSSTTKQSNCIDNLKKSATQTIVINYGHIETKVQLNTTTVPNQLKPVEDKFINCTNKPLEGDALTANLDECTKGFALDFARELGTLKLNYLMKQTLGADGFLAQKSDIDSSLRMYNECLNKLNSLKMSDGLTQKLSVCTEELTNRGMSLVKSNINTWMTSEQKDAATVKIKEEFANFLPCLSNLIPSAPYSPQLQANVESNIKPLVILLGQYIDYNPDNAKQTLEGIIKALSVDLSDVAATKKAKIELLDFLYESGALDQFLKAIVRGTVKDSLVGVSEKEVPNELKGILLQKDNYEKMFNSPEGSKIKMMVMDTLLRPALIDGADIKGAAFKGNMDAIKSDVIKLLVNAPTFGEQAVKISIQSQINDLPGVAKFFARVLYSSDSLDWEKVRLTPAGIEAEAYIKQAVLTPKFTGVVQSPTETKRTMGEAERLVKVAVKSFGR